MKKTDLNTSKILLIILGVLVAIIIGFNSRAIGSKSNSIKWTEAVEQKAEKISQRIFKEPSKIALMMMESFNPE